MTKCNSDQSDQVVETQFWNRIGIVIRIGIGIGIGIDIGIGYN